MDTTTAMTTPRDALAAALVGCRVTTGTYTAAEGSADRILSALGAEGWVLVRDTAPLDEAVAAEGRV